MKKTSKGLYQKQITIVVDGKKKQKAFYGKTIADVNRKLLEYKGEIEKGRLFKDIAIEWWEEHKKTLEINSLKNYSPAVNRSITWFSSSYIKDITSKEINSKILAFARSGMAQKTVTTQLQIIRQILNYAVLIGEAEYNHAISVKIPKNLKKTKREMPIEASIIKIKENVNEPFGLFAFFLLYTGCRRGEALALRYEDIDFENQQININKSVYYKSDKPFIKKPKTDAGIRKIPLLEPLVEALDKSVKKGYIFNYNDEILHNKRFSTLWKNYCKHIQIENVTPHQLRHAYATRLYELNIDEKSAQEIMGHADISTMRNIYTHISEQKRKTTAEQLKGF